MKTTTTWRPKSNSILTLERSNDGKYALYVQGKATGFHDAETIFTALDLLLASEESLRLLQAMRNVPTHRHGDLTEEAHDLWKLLIEEEMKNG